MEDKSKKSKKPFGREMDVEFAPDINPLPRADGDLNPFHNKGHSTDVKSEIDILLRNGSGNQPKI